MTRLTIALTLLSALLAVPMLLSFPADSAAGIQTAAAPQALGAAWSESELWDDGLAEVALYDAERPQYGRIERYEAVLITVKEDFDRAQWVKADPPLAGKNLLPVLKLNAVHSYWTERYPYNFLASVFVQRDDPGKLVKLTLTGQEWCGNTFKEITTWGDSPQMVYSSYFDGAGDGRLALDLRPGDLVEDQLPLTLRGLSFAAGLRLERRMLPSVISTKVREPAELVDTVIEVVESEQVTTGAGSFEAWRVRLVAGDLQQDWWIDSEAPHIVVRMLSNDGRAWTLKSRQRSPYWTQPTVRPVSEL